MFKNMTNYKLYLKSINNFGSSHIWCRNPYPPTTTAAHSFSAPFRLSEIHDSYIVSYSLSNGSQYFVDGDDVTKLRIIFRMIYSPNTEENIKV